MVIDRRRFVTCSLWCAVASTFSGESGAQTVGTLSDSGDDFVCGTLEDFTTDQLTITDFGPGETAIEFKKRVSDYFDITDFGTAAAHLRWKPSDGLTPETDLVTLGCHFLSGSDREQGKVREAANEWIKGDIGERVRFEFDDVPAGRAAVRILIGYPGYKALVGTQGKSAAIDAPTVWLAPRLERKKVTHEFGHVLGLRHEHQHPDRGGALNRQKVIDYFKTNEGWTTSQVYSALLDNWGSEARCIGHPDFTYDSIMSYDIPPNLTMDNRRLSMARRPSVDDLQCLAGLYSRP